MSETYEQTQHDGATHEDPARTGFWAAGRHPVNVGHLVMGLAFLGLAGVWALLGSDVVDDRDLRWLMPLPWVVAGAAGLVATTLSGARRRDRWAGSAYPTSHPTSHPTSPETSEEEQR